MSRKFKKIFLQLSLSVSFLFLGQSYSEGGTINLTSSLVQEQFHDLSKELGIAVHYIPAAPAESLGMLGFDVGVEITGVSLNTKNAYWQSVAPNTPGFLPIPKLHVQKGLPLGFDLGASYASIPGLDVNVIGAEVKYALLSGNLALPALAIRGAYTQLTGVSTLDLKTFVLDLSVSKGIAFVTPFAGVGVIRVNAVEQVDGLDLKAENLDLSKVFAGVKLTLAIINFIAEVDIADVPLYTLRVNVGF